MTKADVDLFEKTQAQIAALHTEISLLAKRTPNDALNEFKLKFINATLAKANILLTDAYQPFSDFSLFNNDVFPSNSDTTFILAQYLNCMEKLRSDNIKQNMSSWYWIISDEELAIRTAPPQKLLRG